VLSEVRTRRRTVAAAAAVLAVSERQAYRLLARYETDGGSGLIHKARGRTSNRSRNEGIRKYVVELVKTRYADFGPTLATEVLLDKHEVRVGRETLTSSSTRELRRADPDRWQRSSLVRAPW
jgi:transposase